MYAITNMGLIDYNKRFVALRASAPGSTHDACLLSCTNIFKDIVGDAIPNKAINLVIIGCLRKTPKIQMNGMLKCRFRIIYKRCRCKLENAKYIIMTCVLLHNLCIAVEGPCLPR